MARYISLMRFADQGIRNIKDTVKRGDAAMAEAEKLGMKITEEYWTMGAYDGVVLFDAPDDETMTAFACKVSSLGNVKTEPMRACRKDEMEGILSKIKYQLLARIISRLRSMSERFAACHAEVSAKAGPFRAPVAPPFPIFDC